MKEQRVGDWQVHSKEHFFKAVLDAIPNGVYCINLDGKISYFNESAQKITGFDAENIIGQTCPHFLPSHLQQCLAEPKTTHWSEEELAIRLKDNSILNVAIQPIPLRDSHEELSGVVEVFRDCSEAEVTRQEIQHLQEMSLLDSLTRLPNRRHSETNLLIRLEEYSRYAWPFGVLLIDIDHFKNINEEHGRVVGDKILRLTTLTLLNSLRPFDFLGRWGGDKFIALVVNVNDAQLFHVADRARRLLEQSAIQVSTGRIQLTTSIGATLAQGGDTVEILLRRADRLMMESKTSGRNRVSLRQAV
jgi:diguanylate cyclase (GGDEF)-like protein/PAS domain S-box-containing protein